MKKIVRLTEGDLHKMIRESVQSILKEFDVDEAAIKANAKCKWNIEII